MAYYLLTSKQFSLLTTLTSEEKKRQASSRAKDTYIYESERPPNGFTIRDAVDKRTLQTLMKTSDWLIEDPDDPSSPIYL